ncbi:MAG: efflux transporter outer membrane subunit [Sterolibacterium sp.]|nr:efflux transporter outer membrane subunit [Sterolibacterium sp.]
MTKPFVTTLALVSLLSVGACANLEPQLPTAQPAIPAEWPLPVTTATATSSLSTADIGWRDFIADPKLTALIARALDNNRDLRVAVLNVERARAQYGIQRADRFPTLGASFNANRSGGDSPLGGTLPNERYSAELGVTGFELDLFGRVRNLSEAALQQYLATDEAQRSSQIALIAEVASAYLTLSADQELQRIAQATLANYTAVLELTAQRHRLGAVSALDVFQASTAVESARADAARFAGQVARDSNALVLLVGGVVEPSLLPQAYAPRVSGLDALPAGLPSEVLLRRPDILQAELRLRAANANIGAARAAFFPSISLTGSVGTASSELSGLFDKGSHVWSFVPSVNLPIFDGGRLRASLGVATADRDIALAQYEKAIQSGFREVADALALSHTLGEQRSAQEALLEAATRAHNLSQARYKAGQDSYLVLLEAQRTLYNTRQSLVTTQSAEQSNRVTLYKVLGGGWKEAKK